MAGSSGGHGGPPRRLQLAALAHERRLGATVHRVPAARVAPRAFGDGGAWCYAVKAHAALAPLVARPDAPERLAFSYVCSDKVWTWPSETDIYVPQFFALDLARI